MNIGIIGTGKIGGTLAEKLSAAGHDVGIANAHGPRSLDEMARDLGLRACPMTVDEAARHGEVVIVSIPFGKFRTVPPEPLRGKIVVDTENYYPDRDGRFRELDDDSTTSTQLVLGHLPGARLVKAFNAVMWTTLRDEGRPLGAMGRLAMPLAGDDLDAKHVVAGLIDEVGFDPVDVGDLAHGGRRIQPGAPVYVAHMSAEEMRRRLAA
jgi:8-hydroxy-5-deazaflavin:NADPH oxidoreductase